jgi:hypothetical protein
MKNKANLTATNRKREGRKQNVLLQNTFIGERKLQLILHSLVTSTTRQIYWGEEIAHDQNILLLLLVRNFGVLHHSKHTMNNNTQMVVNILRYTGHSECELLHSTQQAAENNHIQYNQKCNKQLTEKIICKM